MDANEVARRTAILRQEPFTPLAPRRDRFERLVDPDETLPPKERRRRADRARTKYFRDMAKKRWEGKPRSERLPSRTALLEENKRLRARLAKPCPLCGGVEHVEA